MTSKGLGKPAPVTNPGSGDVTPTPLPGPPLGTHDGLRNYRPAADVRHHLTDDLLADHLAAWGADGRWAS